MIPNRARKTRVSLHFKNNSRTLLKMVRKFRRKLRKKRWPITLRLVSARWSRTEIFLKASRKKEKLSLLTITYSMSSGTKVLGKFLKGSKSKLRSKSPVRATLKKKRNNKMIWPNPTKRRKKLSSHKKNGTSASKRRSKELFLRWSKMKTCPWNHPTFKRFYRSIP